MDGAEAGMLCESLEIRGPNQQKQPETRRTQQWVWTAVSIYFLLYISSSLSLSLPPMLARPSPLLGHQQFLLRYVVICLRRVVQIV